TPWAAGNDKRIMFSGAGTSSATPQVAAAAAIYYRKNHAALDALQPWQRVEAIRYALFKTASKKGSAPGSHKQYFGNGIIQANDALNIPVNDSLAKTPADKMPWFPILTTIFKAKPEAQPGTKMVMFNTELSQLVYYNADLRKILDNEEKSYERIGKKKWKTFADAIIEHPGASIALKQYLMATHM
ncbi:MAG TPA: S8 family serine peptidase, partial [Chitinophagaceae bacterium]